MAAAEAAEVLARGGDKRGDLSGHSSEVAIRSSGKKEETFD